jgi:membrane-bound lytic murein transglycosylase D
MKTFSLRTIVVLLLASASVSPAFANYFNDSTMLCDVDPVIARLDSMSYSLFKRDKFFVADDQLLASINMPADMIPKYTDAEIKEKMKLIPSLIPLNYNAQVKQFIDLFAYKRRGLMTRCLANSQIYFPVFEEILDRKGLPIELKYLPIVESAFNPISISRAGATGLWQMMYGTGAQMGLDINSYIDERRDPVKATEAATDYLKMLYTMYGDWHLVLAAYNSGPGNVNKAIARAGGVKNFWAIMNFLPAETRSYVPTYIAAVYVMTHYQDYKLVSAEPKRELYAVDTVLITAKVSLKHICSNLSIPEDELQFLNPSVKTGIIPNTKEGFPLNLPINYFALFEARKDDIMNDTSLFVREYEPMAAIPKTIWYKVKKNETIAKVASKYGVSVSNIKKWNKLKKAQVYSGQKIKLVIAAPVQNVCSSYAQAFAPKIIEKSAEATKAIEAATDTDIDEEAATTTADTATDSTTTNRIELNKECGCIYYVVQPGDTLWNIAERYNGVSIDKLKADNRSLLNRPIKVGDIVKIFM